LIGTGATAVQCVPHLARACERFYLCQRTPSSVDVRANHAIDPAWFASVATPGWQRRWMDNFAANQTGRVVGEDLVQDGWTDIPRRLHAKLAGYPPESLADPATWAAAWEDADFEKMEAIRARVDAEVANPDTAQKLKAWYQQLCKRPCFHDEYLAAFNAPATVLLDTDGKGVERITPDGVVVAGQAYPVDCIIYATGFEVGTERVARTGFEVTGREGITLTQYWADGMRSLHGLSVHRFPNAFFVQLSQGGNLISNVPHNIVESAQTIALLVRQAQSRGSRVVEASQLAEDDWVAQISAGAGLSLPNADCTPGYYNYEGQPVPKEAHSYGGYPAGAPAFFDFIRQWRESGEFSGMEFS
ncbi:MAG: monooxygenase, partial [Halioglobus sp.]|nr:monooxygenase [Halioglobus sp.]